MGPDIGRRNTARDDDETTEQHLRIPTRAYRRARHMQPTHETPYANASPLGGYVGQPEAAGDGPPLPEGAGHPRPDQRGTTWPTTAGLGDGDLGLGRAGALAEGL